MGIINRLTGISLLLFPDPKWFYKFRQANAEAHINQGIIEKLWAFRKGFFLQTIKLCGITKENHREYLSDRTYNKLHPINKPYSSILDNKLYLPFLLKDHPDIVPRYYYAIDKGRLLKLDKEISENTSLYELCKSLKRLVIKPCSNTYGKGFHLLEWKENSFYLDNKVLDFIDLESFIHSLDKYIVTEFINQHRYASAINQSSVNTVRLLVVFDNERNGFFVARAFHRFGRQGGLVDNLGSEYGGILVFIDTTTGILKNTGLYKEKGKILVKNIITEHPESHKQISGVEIPNWHNMIIKVLSVFNNLSFLKYLGVDIVVTDDGFKILEINSLPDLFAIQAEDGVLKDNRLKRFYLG